MVRICHDPRSEQRGWKPPADYLGDYVPRDKPSKRKQRVKAKQSQKTK